MSKERERGRSTALKLRLCNIIVSQGRESEESGPLDSGRERESPDTAEQEVKEKENATQRE